MTVKPDILQAFCNTEIVIDWHEHEELVPFFMEALEKYEPDLTWHDKVKPSEKPMSCEMEINHFLNVDQENGYLFNDGNSYLELELPNTPIIPIIDVFVDTELPDFTRLLDLL